MIERFLSRLSQSPHADTVLLKGALTLRVWGVPPARPTMDIDLLRRGGEAAKRVSERQLPNWLMRAGAIFNHEVRDALPELGVVRRVTSAKAKNILGWIPRSHEEAITATGKSLVDLGLVK